MKKKWLAKCFRWKVTLLATVLLIIAFVLTASRVLVIVLAQHPAFVAKWVTTILKQPVQIQSMRADWAAFDPGITFNKVLMKNAADQQSFVAVKQITVSINILRSLLHWQLVPGRLKINGVNLDIDHQLNRWQVRGMLRSAKNSQLSAHIAVLSNLLNWLLSEGNVTVSHVNVQYHASNHKIYFLHNVDLRVQNNFFQHRVWGGVIINKLSPTEIRFAAKLDDIDFSDAKFNANVYVQIRHIQLAEWMNELQHYLPRLAVQQGNANIDIWANWHKTKFTRFVGKVKVKQVKASLVGSDQPIVVNSMAVNFIEYPQNDAIALQAKKIIFSLPGIYKTPLLLTDLKTQLRWNKDDAGFHLYVPNYQFLLTTNQYKSANLTRIFHIYAKRRHPAFGLKSRGAVYVSFPRQGQPTIDVLSNFQLPQLNQLPELIPDVHQSATLQSWLKQAFSKGGIPKATLVYRGPIMANPFQNHEGHLSAELQVRNASLRYYFGWPMLTSLNTHINVNDKQISAHFNNAAIDGNHINTLDAKLDNFMQPVLMIKGSIHSDVQHINRFMQDSPIKFKHNSIPLTGPVSVNWQLGIHFNQSPFVVQSDGEATILGSTLQFNLHTASSSVHLNVDGHLNVAPIIRQFSDNLLKNVTGGTDYHASVVINKTHQLDAAFTTDMKGITVSDLPTFITKKAAEVTPVNVHIVADQKEPIHVVLHYRKAMANLKNSTELAMRLLANHHHHFQLLSGEVYVDQPLPAKIPAFPGFVIYGKMARFDWQAWQPFIMPFIHEENGAVDIPEIFGLRLRYVAMQFDQLHLYHQVIKNMRFKLMPRLHDLMFIMNSPEVSGTFFIPNYSGGTWTGQLDHLFIPKIKLSTSKKQQPLKMNPLELPPVNVVINTLHYDNINYGHVNLKIQPTKHGIAINHFSIVAPLFALKMTGNWDQLSGIQATNITGVFQTTNLGQLLTNINMKNTLAEGKGWSSFKLSWIGAPNDVTPAKLNGLITFDFRHGRLLKMDHSKATELSLGRLINAFSLEELPRRLSLHFGDITAKGLEFHHLKGDLKIRNGVCTMKHTLLDSPVAKLTINGVINFPGKYYDLNVSVSPYVTSSVPLIVALAGGPIAGAIAWVANKIATPEIGKMIGFVYHAKGSWDKSKDAKLPVPAETHV